MEIWDAFFCYKGKMFCYLWVHKKNKQPYLCIVEGKYFDEPFLIQEGYLKRTSRGREATEKAYKHLRIVPPVSKGPGLFD